VFHEEPADGEADFVLTDVVAPRAEVFAAPHEDSAAQAIRAIPKVAAHDPNAFASAVLQ